MGTLHTDSDSTSEGRGLQLTESLPPVQGDFVAVASAALTSGENLKATGQVSGYCSDEDGEFSLEPTKGQWRNFLLYVCKTMKTVLEEAARDWKTESRETQLLFQDHFTARRVAQC